MQQKGRLDVATRCSTIRYIIEIVVYCGVLIIIPDLILASSICVIVSFIVMMLTSVNAGRNYTETLKPSFKPESIKRLFVDGFPLFMSMFLNVYISNSPRYAIDAVLNDEMQAIFSYIFMPAFMIQIVAHFIFNPILTTYAMLWLSKEQSKFNRMMCIVKKQCLLVLGLLILALIVASTIGLPILSWMFGVDLSGFKKELCIIMVGGAMLAYSVYFSTIIAIIRVQNSLIVCYGIISVISLMISNRLVAMYGITGAALLYAVIMTGLAGSLAIVVIMQFKKRKIILN
jgi:O-antigen/teichoic acid export membrane protein